MPSREDRPQHVAFPSYLHRSSGQYPLGDTGPVQHGYGGGREALQLLGCLRTLLLDLTFAPGRLDRTTVEMHSALTELVQDNGKFLEAVRNMTSIEPWVQGPGYNPYSS